MDGRAVMCETNEAKVGITLYFLGQLQNAPATFTLLISYELSRKRGHYPSSVICTQRQSYGTRGVKLKVGVGLYYKSQPSALIRTVCEELPDSLYGF